MAGVKWKSKHIITRSSQSQLCHVQKIQVLYLLYLAISSAVFFCFKGQPARSIPSSNSEKNQHQKQKKKRKKRSHQMYLKVPQRYLITFRHFGIYHYWALQFLNRAELCRIRTKTGHLLSSVSSMCWILHLLEKPSVFVHLTHSRMLPPIWCLQLKPSWNMI